VNGELDLAIIRLGIDWTRRTRREVFSLRSTLSAGIDALGATRSPTEPDGEFLTFQIESQYSRRLDDRGNLLVLHAGLGMADGPVPPPAQFRLGGRYTVRGYRENFLVRDNGVGAGVDLQIPIMADDEGHGWNLSLIPFIDGGVAWDDGHEDAESLLAAGIGIRADFSDWFRSELYYGIPLVNRQSGSGDLQDAGIHFRMSLARF
jgi:hemolysin activation/secretion protein